MENQKQQQQQVVLPPWHYSIQVSFANIITDYLEKHSAFHMFGFLFLWWFDFYLSALLETDTGLSWLIFFVPFSLLISGGYKWVWELNQKLRSKGQKVLSSKPVRKFQGLPLEPLSRFLINGNPFSSDGIIDMWGSDLGETTRAQDKKFKQLKSYFIAIGLLIPHVNGRSYILDENKFDSAAKIEDFLAERNDEKLPEIQEENHLELQSAKQRADRLQKPARIVRGLDQSVNT